MEGAKRMMRLGKFLVLAGLGSVLLGAAMILAGGAIPLDANVSWKALNITKDILLYLTGAAPLGIGGLLWLSGWLIEGFFKSA